MKFTDEQKSIIRDIKKFNIMTNAVAGSGKTTSILGIAKTYKNDAILLLTYNSKLKLETREKKAKFELTNLDVQSFHSFAHNYIDNEIIDDTGILLYKHKPITNDHQYKIIILDEVQDLRPLLYELTLKILNKWKMAHICILGDVRQLIYRYMDADERYMLYPHIMFEGNELEWKNKTLEMSFRVSKNVAGFITECMYDNEFNIVGREKGTNRGPEYYVFERISEIYSMIMNDIEVLGYKPDDIMILSPSICKSYQVRELRDMISRLSDIKIFSSLSDQNTETDSRPMLNKIKFLSIHQAKGLEKKIVYVFHFDKSYYKYDKGCKQNKCTNLLYVAATRAKERLILLHDAKCNPLPFLNFSKFKKFNVVVNGKINFKNNIEFKCFKHIKKNLKILGDHYLKSIIKTRPSNLIKTNIEEDQKLIKLRFNGILLQGMTPAVNKNNTIWRLINDKNIDIFNMIELLYDAYIYMSYHTDKKYRYKIVNNENKCVQILINKSTIQKILDMGLNLRVIAVRDFIKFIPIHAIYKINKLIQSETETGDLPTIKIPIIIEQSDNTYELVSDITGLAIPAYFEYNITKKMQILNNLNYRDRKNMPMLHPNISICDLLKIATYSSAVKSKMRYRIKQIKKFDWITKEQLLECCDRLKIIMGTNIKFEVFYTARIENVIINGSIDCISDDTVWELKCVSDLTTEHILQLIVYMWLCKVNNVDVKKFKLFNILTGEIKELFITDENLELIMKILFCVNEHRDATEKSDLIFSKLRDKIVLKCKMCKLDTNYDIV
ncbi:MAG: UvrD-helicase domain-containing protein [Acidimicrobiales bacterium]